MAYTGGSSAFPSSTLLPIALCYHHQLTAVDGKETGCGLLGLQGQMFQKNTKHKISAPKYRDVEFGLQKTRSKF